MKIRKNLKSNKFFKKQNRFIFIKQTKKNQKKFSEFFLIYFLIKKKNNNLFLFQKIKNLNVEINFYIVAKIKLNFILINLIYIIY